MVISTASLGWSITHDRDDHVAVKVYSLHLFFALYVFIISARSVFQVTPDNHSHSILHLTTLLTVVFSFLGSAAILPDSPPSVATSIDDDPVLLGLWYALLGIYTIGCILAYSTPLGPPLQYPPSDIYFEKTVKSITNVDKQNVCGTTSKRPTRSSVVVVLITFVLDASPWDLLLFSYVTKVIWFGNIAESVDIGDLPIVPLKIRATYNYSRMREALREFKLKILFWTPALGTGWQLIWRLIGLNYVVFLVVFVITAVNGVFSYIPPLFMRKFVEYLEVDPDRESKGKGWVYLVGLFMTNILNSLCKSFLFFQRIVHGNID